MQLLKELLASEAQQVRIANGGCDIPPMMAGRRDDDARTALIAQRPRDIKAGKEVAKSNAAAAAAALDAAYGGDGSGTAGGTAKAAARAADRAPGSTAPPRDGIVDASRVVDPHAATAELAARAPWSDLEKCVFLDKFLQYPKNFGKIAAFLRNKTAKDAVAFYYDSKKSIECVVSRALTIAIAIAIIISRACARYTLHVRAGDRKSRCISRRKSRTTTPRYKALLREHQQRRRGVRICWDATARAARACGAELEYDEPSGAVRFKLPSHAHTYATHALHPPRARPSAAVEAARRAAGQRTAMSAASAAVRGRLPPGHPGHFHPEHHAGGAHGHHGGHYHHSLQPTTQGMHPSGGSGAYSNAAGVHADGELGSDGKPIGIPAPLRSPAKPKARPVPGGDGERKDKGPDGSDLLAAGGAGGASGEGGASGSGKSGQPRKRSKEGGSSRRLDGSSGSGGASKPQRPSQSGGKRERGDQSSSGGGGNGSRDGGRDGRGDGGLGAYGGSLGSGGYGSSGMGTDGRGGMGGYSSGGMATYGTMGSDALSRALAGGGLSGISGSLSSALGLSGYDSFGLSSLDMREHREHRERAAAALFAATGGAGGSLGGHGVSAGASALAAAMAAATGGSADGLGMLSDGFGGLSGDPRGRFDSMLGGGLLGGMLGGALAERAAAAAAGAARRQQAQQQQHAQQQQQYAAGMQQQIGAGFNTVGADGWSAAEKEAFLRHFRSHGKNWAMLMRLIPSKTEAQIKTYYQSYKTSLGLQHRQDQVGMLPGGGGGSGGVAGAAPSLVGGPGSGAAGVSAAMARGLGAGELGMSGLGLDAGVGGWAGSLAADLQQRRAAAMAAALGAPPSQFASLLGSTGGAGGPGAGGATFASLQQAAAAAIANAQQQQAQAQAVQVQQAQQVQAQQVQHQQVVQQQPPGGGGPPVGPPGGGGDRRGLNVNVPPGGVPVSPGSSVGAPAATPGPMPPGGLPPGAPPPGAGRGAFDAWMAQVGGRVVSCRVSRLDLGTCRVWLSV